MAYIQPTSEVWLCANVPLDPSYDNQLTFTSGSGASRVWDSVAQRAYFASKAVYHPTNFSIVKERDGVLRMSGEVSQFYNINYMYFVNPPFGSGLTSKYFYAFVTQVEYINPNTTFIYFELDYFQTWAADIVWMESVIEREHVEDDRMYKNLEDEGIEVNDMEPYAEEYLDSVLGQKILVVGASESYTQMIEQIQNEGLQIYYYPYDKDYPIYNSTYTSRKSEKITTFFAYSNDIIVPYSTVNYDPNTNIINITGLQNVNIDKIRFTLHVGNNGDIYYVKGVLSGSEWVYSIDGIRINYHPYTEYPNLTAVQAYDIWDIWCYIGTKSTGTNAFYDKWNQIRHLVVGGQDWSTILIGLVPNTVDNIYFTVGSAGYVVGGDEYKVHGYLSNGSWVFEEDNS